MLSHREQPLSRMNNFTCFVRYLDGPTHNKKGRDRPLPPVRLPGLRGHISSSIHTKDLKVIMGRFLPTNSPFVCTFPGS